MPKTILKITLTFFILFLLIYSVGWGKLINILRGTYLPALVVMYGLSLFARLVQAFQMQVILKKACHPLRLARIFLANALSALYSLVLPGDVIASVAKWANLSAATGKKSTVLNAIVYNRLALLLPPLVIGACSIVFENPFPDIPLAEIMVCVAAAGVLATVGIFHPYLGSHLDRMITGLTGFLPEGWRKKIGAVLSSLHDFRAFRLKDHLQIYCIGTISLFSGLIEFFFAARAVGIAVPFLTLAWVMAILHATRQVPITISNLGVREGLLITLLGAYGIEAERAFALGLVMFSNQLLGACIGAIYQIALSTGFAKWKNRS